MVDVNVSVLLLAALSSGIPTSLIHWSMAKNVRDGVVLSGFSKALVKKSKGVQLYFFDFIFWAVITVGLDLAFAQVYEQNIDRIPYSFAGVIMLLVVVSRSRVGGKYSVKEKMFYAPFTIAGALLVLYGIGWNLPL